MSLDLEDELRSALGAYREALPPAPDLAAAASRGGARRQRRHRAAVLAAPALVVLLMVGGVLVPRWTYSPPDPTRAAASLSTLDQALLAAPTGGDLAGDGAYLDAVRTAWRHSHRRSGNADRGIFDHLLGAPVVAWAGTTPAGPAAVVVQLADLRAHDDVQLTREGVALLWGFVGPADGGPTVVADAYPVPGAPDVEAAWIGADRRTLLVADRGNAAEEVSWGLSYDDATGRVQRRWEPVRFSDGAAVLTRPADTRPEAIRIRYQDGSAEIANTGGEAYLDAEPVRLPWRGDTGYRVFPVGADPTGPRPDGYAAQDLLETGLADRLPAGWPDYRLRAWSLWYAVGRTPDGSRLVAGEYVFDADPSRVYAVLTGPGRATRAVSARVRFDRAVPVDVTLPDGQGRLVAAQGHLFTWTAAGALRAARDAALVPVGATDLRVDGTPVTQ